MTRWARTGQANQQRAHNATSWSELRSPLPQTREQKKKAVNKQVPPLRRAGDSSAHYTISTEKSHLLNFIRKDRKREGRRLKRIQTKENSRVCYNCRQLGHDMENCPKMNNEDEGTGICFRCGSTEHKVDKCHMKGELQYAKCFICSQMGHLSKQCPDNPRGLYPEGGCCRVCGSVEHYKRDCPELRQQKCADEITLDVITPFGSVDAESVGADIGGKTKSGPKIVKF